MWKIVKFCSVVGDSLLFVYLRKKQLGETGKSKEEKGMLNLKIEDKNPNIKQELKEYMEGKRSVLNQILEGETDYKDSLGWFHTAEWADVEQTERIQKLADETGKRQTFL